MFRVASNQGSTFRGPYRPKADDSISVQITHGSDNSLEAGVCSRELKAASIFSLPEKTAFLVILNLPVDHD